MNRTPKFTQKMCEICRKRISDSQKTTLVECESWNGTISYGEAHIECKVAIAKAEKGDG